MTPTDAARLITDMKPSGAKQFLVREHGEAIARALLDAEERNANLKGILRNAEKVRTECLRFLNKIRRDERIHSSQDAWDEINDFVARLESLRKAGENDL